MSDATLVVIALGLGTYALKAAGPLILGGRSLPPVFSHIARLVPAAMLAALVAVATFVSDGRYTIDARAGGLAAAAVALALRLPFVVVVIVAALVTALIRAL